MSMRPRICAALLALSFAILAPSAAKAAQEWGTTNEETARFEAKVVDILCELTGDCPEACGGGARQLGLLQADGTLVLPAKNFVPFAGAADELIDFCGKTVVADGLFTEKQGVRLFALQFVREAPDGKWRRGNRFVTKWNEAHGLPADAKKGNQWFRHDPRVLERIEAEGYLGRGPEAEQEFLKEWQ
jgi:hypothetical protein